MTIEELKHKVITTALQKHNGNAELAALETGLTSRTIFTFKSEQKKITENPDHMKEIDEMLDQWIHNSIVRKQLRDLIIKYNKNTWKKN